jgi:hypothetical protein
MRNQSGVEVLRAGVMERRPVEVSEEAVGIEREK